LTEVRRPDFGALRTGEADLIVEHAPRLPREAEATVVAMMRTFIVVPSDHPLARRRALGLVNLRSEPFVAYAEDLDGRRLQLDALERADVVPPRVHAADSAEGIIAFVAAGLGVSVIPWLDERGPKAAGVTVHRLDVPGASFPVHAVRRRPRSPDPLVDAALEVAPRP
jgi:DNA-binding transcriptional LysR family regulator